MLVAFTHVEPHDAVKGLGIGRQQSKAGGLPFVCHLHLFPQKPLVMPVPRLEWAGQRQINSSGSCGTLLPISYLSQELGSSWVKSNRSFFF
jgi:hypothetical protein